MATLNATTWTSFCSTGGVLSAEAGGRRPTYFGERQNLYKPGKENAFLFLCCFLVQAGGAQVTPLS